MSPELILGLIAKAVDILPTLVQAGIDITERVSKIRVLAEAAKHGTVTHDMVLEIRAQLDADLDEFNAPVPDDGA